MQSRGCRCDPGYCNRAKLPTLVNLKTAQTLGLTITREFQLRADEAIRIAVLFAALHKFAFGTKPTSRDLHLLVRFRGEADMRGCFARTGSGAIDPKRT